MPGAEGIAVVLVSGGLDSATLLAMARRDGWRCHALTFRYGQRHEHEIEAARAVCAAMDVERHVVAEIDSAAFGGSALTGDAPLPLDREPGKIGTGIPATYVPARNAILLSWSLGYAESIGAKDLFIGVNAIDFSGYPDCRPAFLEAFEVMANLATKVGVEGGGIRIHAPLIEWSKGRIIREGVGLDVDYALTTSCYDPGDEGAPCNRCDACVLRAGGFAEAGVEDPLRPRVDA